jgi:hypothetical protein
MHSTPDQVTKVKKDAGCKRLYFIVLAFLFAIDEFLRQPHYRPSIEPFQFSIVCHVSEDFVCLLVMRRAVGLKTQLMTIAVPLNSCLTIAGFSIRLPLHANLCSFGSIVGGCYLLEPWVLKCLLGGNTFCRIVDEDLAEEIQKESAEVVVVGYYILH